MKKQAAPSFSLVVFARLLGENRKQASLYTIAFLFAAIVCYLVPAAIVQLICFAVLGIANAWLLSVVKLLPGLSITGTKPAFVVLLFALMVLVLLVFYYFSGSGYVIMAFANGAAFLLPFLLYHGWNTFNAIPAKEFEPWFLPANETHNNIIIATSNQLQLQLAIRRKNDDANALLYPVAAPVKCKPGKLLEMVIAGSAGNAGAVIDIKDRQQHLFGWQFYELKFGGLYKRRLDPNVSLSVNKIGANATIAAERINTADQKQSL